MKDYTKRQYPFGIILESKGRFNVQSMTKKTAIIGKEKVQLLGHTKGATVKWRYGESRSFGNFYK